MTAFYIVAAGAGLLRRSTTRRSRTARRPTIRPRPPSTRSTATPTEAGRSARTSIASDPEARSRQTLGSAVHRGHDAQDSARASSARATSTTLLGLFPSAGICWRQRPRREPVFPLGADRLGRCVSTAASCRARRSRLSVGLAGVLLSLSIGVLIGGISGYYGGRDRFRRAARDRVRPGAADHPDLARPVRGAAAELVQRRRNYFMITLILSLTGWAQLARVVRGRFLSLRTEEFVTGRRGSTARPRAASSSATCCRASPATSSPRSRWPSPR